MEKEMEYTMIMVVQNLTENIEMEDEKEKDYYDNKLVIESQYLYGERK